MLGKSPVPGKHPEHRLSLKGLVPAGHVALQGEQAAVGCFCPLDNQSIKSPGT